MLVYSCSLLLFFASLLQVLRQKCWNMWKMWGLWPKFSISALQLHVQSKQKKGCIVTAMLTSERAPMLGPECAKEIALVSSFWWMDLSTTLYSVKINWRVPPMRFHGFLWYLQNMLAKESSWYTCDKIPWNGNRIRCLSKYLSALLIAWLEPRGPMADCYCLFKHVTWGHSATVCCHNACCKACSCWRISAPTAWKSKSKVSVLVAPSDYAKVHRSSLCICFILKQLLAYLLNGRCSWYFLIINRVQGPAQFRNILIKDLVSHVVQISNF